MSKHCSFELALQGPSGDVPLSFSAKRQWTSRRRQMVKWLSHLSTRSTTGVRRSTIDPLPTSHGDADVSHAAQCRHNVSNALSLDAIAVTTMDIRRENGIDLESPSSEFEFVELARQVGQFVSQHPHVDVVRLKSAMSDLQRQLAGQSRGPANLQKRMGG
jgi:hypothetical protein